jgi:hypothetical protein
MIKSLSRSLALFGATKDVPVYARGWEALSELNHRVNENIEIVSSYQATIHEQQVGNHMTAEVSSTVQPGDMLLLMVASSKGIITSEPEGFQTILPAIDKTRDFSLRLSSMIWQDGHEYFYEIPREAENCLVTMLTIRGAHYAKARARIDSSMCGGKAIAPRVRTLDGGATLSAFFYSSANPITIEKHPTLLSLNNGFDGLAIGVEESHGGWSRRIKADVPKASCNIDDIALAVSLF